MQVCKCGAEPLLAFGVEARGGLIEEKQLWRSQQGARNRQALPHAPRKCPDQIVRAARKPHRLERLPRACDGVRQVKEFCEKDEIFCGGELVVHKSVVSDHSYAVLYGSGR